MAETETESADADDDSDEREQYPWVKPSPDSRISGVPEGVIYSGRIDSTVEQNGSSFGVVLGDIGVENGNVWVNEAKESDGTTDDGTDEDEPRPTDYRVADPDDEGVNVNEVKGERFLATDEEGPSTYETTDGIDEDTAIVWFNGLAGQRIARVLDFNGRPFARWTDDGDYLVKGLYQVAEGWREDGADKGEMVRSGKGPRVARAPILRTRVEVERDDDGDISDATLLDEPEPRRLLFDLSRAKSGRGYRAHVFDAEAFANEAGATDAEMPRSESGWVEADSELEMPYSPVADDILESAGYSMAMYTGDGWQDEPSAWSPSSTSEVSSFGVSSVETGDTDDADVDGLTAREEQFVEEVVDELKGTGMTPEEAFDGGLSGLVGKFSDRFERAPDVGELREDVYARLNHLDAADLDD